MCATHRLQICAMAMLLFDRISKQRRAGYTYNYTYVYVYVRTICCARRFVDCLLFRVPSKIIAAIIFTIIFALKQNLFPLGHASHLVYDELKENQSK